MINISILYVRKKPTNLKESIAPMGFAIVNHAQSKFVVSNLPY
jgi:hypothetical protein